MDDDLGTDTDLRVAEILSDLEQLDDLAVDQHVAVFEMTHAKLRGLLTDQGHLAPHAQAQQAPGPAGT
jgi:hypothetical protein